MQVIRRHTKILWAAATVVFGVFAASGCSRSETSTANGEIDATAASNTADGNQRAGSGRKPVPTSGTSSSAGAGAANGPASGTSSPPGVPATRYSEDVIQSLIAPQVWTWEERLDFARQRPAALLIACNEYPERNSLKHPVDDALELAGRLAECGYDVKLLVGVLPTDVYASHPQLAKVREQIARINERLKQRNDSDSVAKEVAPLRLLDDPAVFVDDASFWLKYEDWLSGAFARQLPKRTSEQSVVNSTQFESARPPFGFTYLGGHGVEGRTGVLFKTPLGARVATAAPLAANSPAPMLAAYEVTVRTISRVAAFKYHAPLWMIADMCRVQAEPGQSEKEPPAASLVHRPSRLRSGELEYPATLTENAKKLAARVESLQANAVVGGLMTNSRVNRAEDYSASVMFPDRYSRPIEDKLGIAPRVAHLLRIAVPDTGASYFETVNEADKPYEQTLYALYTQASRLLLDADRRLNSELRVGPIDHDMIVASSLRGFRYERVENHLFSGGLIVDELHTGFTVNHDESGAIPFRRIEIQRDQEEFNSDFKAVVKLNEPASIPEGPSKLVLQVWASSPQPNDGLSFIVGAYDNAKESPQQLTTHFISYGKAQCYGSPLPCDGRLRFVEVPLDGEIEPSTRLSSFEIQANPQLPESWRKGAQLCITFAAIVPIDVDPETLQSSERVFSRSDNYPNLLSTWWTDTELAVKGAKVEARRDGQLGKPMLLMSFTPQQAIANGGWSGCTGELYPRQFVDKDRHVLRLKATAEAAAAENPKAFLGVVVYDGRRLLSAWYGTAAEVRDGLAIPLAATGIANEIAVVAVGVKTLNIEEMQFERAQ